MKKGLLFRLAGMFFAFALGAVVALATRRAAGPNLSKSLVAGAQRTGRSVSRSVEAMKDRLSGGKSPREKYSSAWNELTTRGLPDKEARAAAMKLLEKWAEVDPVGALDAALQANRKGWNKVKLSVDLLSALDRSFQEQPDVYLKQLDDGKLGLEGQQVAERWVRSVAKNDPLFAATQLDRIPPARRNEAISAIKRSLRSHPEQRESVEATLERFQ